MGEFAENKQRFAATYTNKGTGKNYAFILTGVMQLQDNIPNSIT